MSEKDRLKKDHERTNKKNKAMRAQENAQVHTASPKHQAKDESNLTGTQPGPSR